MTTIYVPSTRHHAGTASSPDSQGTTTVATLIARVNEKVGNYTRQAYASFRGNFLQTAFVLPHRNVSNLQCVLSGLRTSFFTVVSATGVITFTTAPPSVPVDEPDNVFVSYEYIPWTDAEITEALNASVNELWGKFYWEGMHDDIDTTGHPEYLVQDSDHNDIPPDSRVTRVEWSTESGADAAWVKLERWHVRASGGHKYVVLEQPIFTGYYLRFCFQCPGGIISATTDTLETTVGLPTRAADALVTMACANLLEGGIGRRFDSLTRGTVPDANQIKSYEIIQDIQLLRNAAFAKAQRVMMQPFSARIIV